MSYSLTLDWDAIQERNIDPFSPVDSDNHNKLLKILGNHKAYIKGFDISYTIDNNKLVAHIDRGICVIQHMVIEFTDPATFLLLETPITERDICVVIEYQYRKIQPIFIATIKSILESEYDPNIHLKLYSCHIGSWSALPIMEDWMTYRETHCTDHRKDQEVIPEWAWDTFVKRAGDEMTGFLTLHADPVANMHSVTKQYVDYLIANHTDMHDSRYVKKAGDIMTGYLTLHNNPTLDLHAATKQYVDHHIKNHDVEHDDRFVKLEGSTMTGFLTLNADPVNNFHAVPKRYLDYQISTHNHDSRYVQKAGDTMTGNLSLDNCQLVFKDVGFLRREGVKFRIESHNELKLHSDNDTKISFNCNNTEIANVQTTGLAFSTTATSKITFAGVGALQALTNTNLSLVSNNQLTLNSKNGTKISFVFDANEIAYINQYGLVGSVYSADIVEFFEHELKVQPKQGQCVVLNEEGKAIISNKLADTSVIGLVSYSPGLTLGGTTEFKEEFNKGRIPVALMGQIHDVCILAAQDYSAGTLLVSFENGFLTPANDVQFVPTGAIIGKALNKIKAGISLNNRVLIFQA